MFKQRISFVLIISVLTIIFFQHCYLKCQESAEGPLLVLDEISFDFGEVKEGNVLSHVFNFKNCGTDTLRIKRVRGTWGCTASLLSSEVIAPGEVGEINVSFKTKNRKGKNSKKIYIYSNDAEAGIRKLSVSAFVIPNKHPEES